MLREPTFEKLHAMKLHAMAQAYEEYLRAPGGEELPFEERFAMMVERQWCQKQDRALARRLQVAQLRHAACIEDIDYRHPRGLKRAQIESLSDSRWIKRREGCIITGPTGAGKSYLACALAHKACREGYAVLYYYTPKLFRQLATAQLDGSFMKLLKRLAQADLLVIDDWGVAALKPAQYRDFLEVIEDRHASRSTLLTSQFPVESWHEIIADATVADAILDRLVHNAHRIELRGESMRKRKPTDS
jgi:DNA replication protein DnaC